MIYIILFFLSLIFFNFFKKFKTKSKNDNLEEIIDNNPSIRALDKQIGDLNRQAEKRIKSSPDYYNLFKKAGIEIGDDKN